MTALDLARRHQGITELPGGTDHPLIQWWLSLCNYGTDAHDEVPWCSAFVNGIAWLLDLPMSKSAAARSWLNFGQVITASEAVPGNDIVILSRLGGHHVGFYAGRDPSNVFICGGNQANKVSTIPFAHSRVLGYRRLAPAPTGLVAPTHNPAAAAVPGPIP